MTLAEAMTKLEAAGLEKVRVQNEKRGATGQQFGCNMGEIRKIAKLIKIDSALGKELFQTNNLDARFLSCLIIKPNDLTESELEEMFSQITYTHLADWFISYIIKSHKQKEALRQKWMDSNQPMIYRAAWSLTTERVCKDPTGLDLPALLNRIDHELPTAHEWPQWTLNYCLAEIGIRNPELREQALNIGESHGVYRNYPVSKGCTSPFAPSWISEMVSRQ